MTVADPISLSPVAGQHMTVGEFARLPDHAGLELIDGRVVSTAMATREAWIAGEVFRRVSNFVVEHRLGRAFPKETVLRCFEGDNFRKVDAAFISTARLPGETSLFEDLTVAPDLAVEVLSPGNTFYDIEIKIRQYLEAGTKLVWVINPLTESVRSYESGKRPVEQWREETLSGGEVLPGFSIKIADLFAGA